MPLAVVYAAEHFRSAVSPEEVRLREASHLAVQAVSRQEASDSVVPAGALRAESDLSVAAFRLAVPLQAVL